MVTPESPESINPKQRPDPAPQKLYSKTTPHLCLLLAVTIWASGLISIKVVLLQLPPTTIALLYCLVASLALGIYLLCKHQPAILHTDWLRLAGCGLTGITLYEFFQNQGLQFTGPTDAAILTCMSPVFIALLSWLILKEQISRVQTLGIIVALTGSVVVATNGSLTGLSLNPLRLYGDSMLLLAGLSWATYCILVKPLFERYPITTVLAYSTFVGTLFLIIPSLTELPINFAAVTLSSWLNILYLGLFIFALAYQLWNFGFSRVPTVTAASYLYLIPALTAVLSTIYYKQLPSLATVIGGLIVLMGTYLTAEIRGKKLDSNSF